MDANYSTIILVHKIYLSRSNKKWDAPEAEVNRAKGTAEAQKLLRQSLNPALLQKQAIEKWDGKFPTVMGGNGTLPLINVSPSKN